MAMNLNIKFFDELTLDELYAVLKLRVDVFVVEQECAYPELDGLDRAALHVFLTDDNGAMAAYLRILEHEPGTAQIGRVIAARRGEGLGRKIMEVGMDAARERMGADEVYIEAQVYAKGFYEGLGFVACSDEFDEDGIPHVQMRRKL